MSRRLTQEEFLSRCRAAHGDKYDYSRAVYTTCFSEVEIVCPEHGIFRQKAINHTQGHGCIQCGIERVRESKRKSDSKEDADRIIREAIDVCGTFPTHRMVVENDLWDANRIILRLGGYAKARSHYKYDLLEKPKRHWEDLNNVRAYLKKHFPALYKAGQCPTLQMMYATGEYPSFVYKHGGMSGLCRKLRLEPICGFLTRDGHLVRSYFELLLDEYLYSRDLDHEPEVLPFEKETYRCDQKVGDHYIELWGLSTPAYKKRRKLKESLYSKQGLKLIGLDACLFINKTIRQTELELDRIFSEYGLRTQRKRPYSLKAITQQVNYPWSEDVVIEHIRKFMAKHGEFPTQKKLRKHGMSGLGARIHQFGGFRCFRRVLKEPQWHPPYKWTEEAVLERIKALCQELGRFPKDCELGSDLRNAVRNKSYLQKRDLNYFRELLGYEITKRSKGYWTPKNVERELLAVIKRNNDEFPTNTRLREMKRSDLATAIQQTGGFNVWRKNLGHKILQRRQPRRSPGQNTNEALIEELKQLIEKYGAIPKQKDLREIAPAFLYAVTRRGGVRAFVGKLIEQGMYEEICERFLSRPGGNRKSK